MSLVYECTAPNGQRRDAAMAKQQRHVAHQERDECELMSTTNRTHTCGVHVLRTLHCSCMCSCTACCVHGGPFAAEWNEDESCPASDRNQRLRSTAGCERDACVSPRVRMSRAATGILLSAESRNACTFTCIERTVYFVSCAHTIPIVSQSVAAQTPDTQSTLTLLLIERCAASVSHWSMQGWMLVC